METTNTNPLLCDPETGMCALPEAPATAPVAGGATAGKALKIIYFTDPICSSCWGIEPQLRRLKLEYGTSLDIEYRMGGLLPDWSYNSGGISKPSDVAHHWDEVSLHYDMPIDGDVWLEDPLPSSYPPSIAFKAAQLQGNANAILFLREIREMVFLRKKNITRWEHLEAAAANVGLQVDTFRTDFENVANGLFAQDLALAREWGVRGFPTLFFLEGSGQRDVVYGTKPYAVYEAALLHRNPSARKQPYEKTWEALFASYASLTAREFSVLSDTPRPESEALLNRLSDQGALEKITTKNGAIWRLPATRH